MAHGPSPFGVPQQTQGRRNQTDPGFWAEYDAGASAPTVRLGSAHADRTPDAEMEAELEHLQASRPLRRAAQRARRRTKWWLIALAIVSALAVAAACAAGAFIVLRGGDPDEKAEGASEANASSVDATSGAPEVVDPIASRETDAAPISVAELFGSGAVAPAGAVGVYEVLDTEELSDCAAAGLDELAELLAASGCTQTVRATVVSPDGEFAATAGVLNLADAEEAEAMREAIPDLDGGFAALRTDGAAAELGRAATMVGYNTYGHYLMYVVIGRTDGEAIEDAGEPVRAIVGDLVDVWLVDQLKPRRDVQ